MTIKITSCSVPGIWYENKIGMVYEAIKPHGSYCRKGYEGGYFINGNPSFAVKKSDCIEVKEQEQTKVIYHRELITVYSNKQHVA